MSAVRFERPSGVFGSLEGSLGRRAWKGAWRPECLAGLEMPGRERPFVALEARP